MPKRSGKTTPIPGDSPAERMAKYDRELRELKDQKREAAREANDRIKLIEGFMHDLAAEILGDLGAPTGQLFGRGADEDGE